MIKPKRALGSLLLLLLAACGSAPQRLPVALEQAQQADRAAHRSLREGDLLQARALFTQTLRLQQSLDNLAGAAEAAINLATVAHRLGDDGTALQQLDRVLAYAGIPPELRAAAAFRKAVIVVDNGPEKTADAAVQGADAECRKQCAYAAGILNLKARLALRKNAYAEALQFAQAAIDDPGIGKEELANARRSAAAAESGNGRHSEALAHYETALELDKQLGLSPRIALDLQGIAGSLAQLGRKAEADDYARRAAAVVEAQHSLAGDAAKH